MNHSVNKLERNKQSKQSKQTSLRLGVTRQLRGSHATVTRDAFSGVFFVVVTVECQECGPAWQTQWQAVAGSLLSPSSQSTPARPHRSSVTDHREEGSNSAAPSCHQHERRTVFRRLHTVTYDGPSMVYLDLRPYSIYTCARLPSLGDTPGHTFTPHQHRGNTGYAGVTRPY